MDVIEHSASLMLEELLRKPNGTPLGRFEFLPLIPDSADLLEIGPAHVPCFRGDRVRYFDVQDSEGLRRRAEELDVLNLYGQDPADTPANIHYVSPVADLGIVDRQFDFVFSSHAIEHQVDMIAHLQAVSRVLNHGGAYLVICPDRRYCFDANRPDSSIGQIIEAYHFRRQRHSLATLIDDHVYRTHNDGRRHWDGDTPTIQYFPASNVLDALALWKHSDATGEYIDRHGWVFTPTSFQLIMNCIYDAGLIDLNPRRVFESPRYAGEFISVFLKD